MKTALITGITLDVIGTILIAYTALRVHDRVRKEHHIDSQVVREMHRERLLGLIGVLLIILGYIFQVVGVSILS
ncbi:MAG: hypothetical protein HYT46_02260 [Candidatus Vogelbacteria bacterium]|nr:hypothetical protein [Candidatus Vogelbacteria bacterium]